MDDVEGIGIDDVVYYIATCTMYIATGYLAFIFQYLDQMSQKVILFK